MASDYITEQMEEDHNRRVFESNMREVAIYIITGKSEAGAISYVEEMQLLREQAISQGEYIQDEDGNIEGFYASELDYPSESNINPKQIFAIQQKLIQKYG